MQYINYPNKKTYYIASDGGLISFGEVLESQCLATGLSSLKTFTDENEYKKTLLGLGVKIDNNGFNNLSEELTV